MSLWAEVCRLYVLATLVVALAGKARDVRAFRSAVAQLAAVPAWLAGPTAAAVIAAELSLTVALIAGGRWNEGGLIGGVLLFGAFTAAIAAALARGQPVSCSCFGPSQRPISASDLVRSLTLVAACAFSWLATGEPRLPPLAQGLVFAGLSVLVLASVRLQAGRPRRRSALAEGQPTPAFRGRLFLGDVPIGPEIFRDQPAVVAFVAAGCPKCLATVATLREMLGDMARAGVALWIVPIGLERRDFPQVTGDPQLSPRVLQIDLDECRHLNPEMAAPYYIFIDHLAVVQASGVVGDANWTSFAAQVEAEAA